MRQSLERNCMLQIILQNPVIRETCKDFRGEVTFQDQIVRPSLKQWSVHMLFNQSK